MFVRIVAALSGGLLLGIAALALLVVAGYAIVAWILNLMGVMS
jgi:hypothetical protein